VRVARLLLTLSWRMGRFGEDGIQLPPALTRQKVAGLVGFTQETAWFEATSGACVRRRTTHSRGRIGRGADKRLTGNG